MDDTQADTAEVEEECLQGHADHAILWEGVVFLRHHNSSKVGLRSLTSMLYNCNLVCVCQALSAVSVPTLFLVSFDGYLSFVGSSRFG